MVDLLESLPDAKDIEILLPWYTLAENDIHLLVNAISNHSCQTVFFELNGRVPDGANDALRNASVTKEVLSAFLQLNNLKGLSLESLSLTLEEAREIASQLSTNTCTAEGLRIVGCVFQYDKGAKLVANAFRENTQLKQLSLQDMMLEGNAFTDELLLSLPLNRSIEWFTHLFTTGHPHSTLLDLIKRIAKQNSTIKLFNSLRPLTFARLSNDERRELDEAVRESYTLEEVFMNTHYCSIITTLNKAGRRYLFDGNANSKSTCIDVLTHEQVRDDLDCLFYHLRENPVLFAAPGAKGGGSQQDGNVAGRKRKIDDAAERHDE